MPHYAHQSNRYVSMHIVRVLAFCNSYRTVAKRAHRPCFSKRTRNANIRRHQTHNTANRSLVFECIHTTVGGNGGGGTGTHTQQTVHSKCKAEKRYNRQHVSASPPHCLQSSTKLVASTVRDLQASEHDHG